METTRSLALACAAGCLAGAALVPATGAAQSGGSLAPDSASQSVGGGTQAPEESSPQVSAPDVAEGASPAVKPTPRVEALVDPAELALRLSAPARGDLVSSLAAKTALPPLVFLASQVTPPQPGADATVTSSAPRWVRVASRAQAPAARALPASGADVATVLMIGIAMWAAGLGGLALSCAGRARVI